MFGIEKGNLKVVWFPAVKPRLTPEIYTMPTDGITGEKVCSFMILTDYTLNTHIEIILKLQTREFRLY